MADQHDAHDADGNGIRNGVIISITLAAIVIVLLFRMIPG